MINIKPIYNKFCIITEIIIAIQNVKHKTHENSFNKNFSIYDFEKHRLTKRNSI